MSKQTKLRIWLAFVATVSWMVSYQAYLAVDHHNDVWPLFLSAVTFFGATAATVALVIIITDDIITDSKRQ